MKNREIILESLRTLTEDERIYRRYHELKSAGDGAGLQEFIAGLDPDFVREHYLLLPEFPFIKIYDFLSEKTVLNPIVSQDVMNAITGHPVNITKHLCYTPVFLHTHDFFEIVYVLEGHCHQRIGDEYLELKAGDICFLPPYTKHTMEVFDESIVLNIILRHDTFVDTFFNTLRMDNVLSRFFMSCLYSKDPGSRIVIHTGDDEDIRDSVLSMVLETLRSDVYSDRLLANMIPIFFTRILRGYGRTASIGGARRKSNENALSMLLFIHEHFDGDISLEAVADRFGYSTAHTSRLIKEETGRNFTALLRKLRIEKGKELLTRTGSSVAAIAESCGYESPESFIRAFEKETAMSPTKWRLNYRE